MQNPYSNLSKRQAYNKAMKAARNIRTSKNKGKAIGRWADAARAMLGA